MDRLSRFISAGQALSNKGNVRGIQRDHVVSSERIDDRIMRYVVDVVGKNIEVIIWADQRSCIIGSMDQYGFTDSVAVKTAIQSFYDEVPSTSSLVEMSMSLPGVVYKSLINDSDYGIIDNDGSIVKSVIDDFSERVERYATSVAEILSAFDDAINACNTFTKHDLSWVSAILIESAGRYGERMSDITPDEFIGIVCRRKNDLSRSWLLEPPFVITNDMAMAAFLSISSEKNVSDRDIEIMGMLLDHITETDDLAKRMIGGTDFYYAERIIMRERRRGHVQLATRLADNIRSTADVRSHMREAALLRQEFGLPDVDGYFINSFIEEPNGKRLIDAEYSHPEIDVDDLLSKAWKKHGKETRYMSFFAENGYADDIMNRLGKVPQLEFGSEVSQNQDDFERLCISLSKTGMYDGSLRIALSLLEGMIRSKDEDGIEHMIEISNHIVDSAGRPDDLVELCISFRSENGPRKGYWSSDEWTAFDISK